MSAKLDAVNVMLRAIGETPVSTLATGLPDAADAEVTLDLVKKRVLDEGWSVNTDYNIDFVPTLEDGFIRLSDNILRIDGSDREALDVVVRTDPTDQLRKLFNREKQTFKFDRKVNCNVVRNLDFNDLPFSLQTYLSVQAARQFQQDVMGSVVLDKFLLNTEASAWAKFIDSEAEAEDSNTLRDSAHCAFIANRNSNIRGY
jgi:hypothetical protein